MRRKSQVAEGQRYAKVYDRHGYRSGWEVHSIIVPVKSMPHARLVNLDDPGDIRTVSCLTIANSQYFRLIGESQQGSL